MVVVNLSSTRSRVPWNPNDYSALHNRLDRRYTDGTESDKHQAFSPSSKATDTFTMLRKSMAESCHLLSRRPERSSLSFLSCRRLEGLRRLHTHAKIPLAVLQALSPFSDVLEQFKNFSSHSRHKLFHEGSRAFFQFLKEPRQFM